MPFSPYRNNSHENKPARCVCVCVDAQQKYEKGKKKVKLKIYENNFNGIKKKKKKQRTSAFPGRSTPPVTTKNIPAGKFDKSTTFFHPQPPSINHTHTQMRKKKERKSCGQSSMKKASTFLPINCAGRHERLSAPDKK